MKYQDTCVLSGDDLDNKTGPNYLYRIAYLAVYCSEDYPGTTETFRMNNI